MLLLLGIQNHRVSVLVGGKDHKDHDSTDRRMLMRGPSQHLLFGLIWTISVVLFSAIHRFNTCF